MKVYICDLIYGKMDLCSFRVAKNTLLNSSLKHDLFIAGDTHFRKV